MTEDDGDARITFRINEEEKRRFERAIHLAKAKERLDEDVSKSELLRESVGEIIEELEGNPNPTTAHS